VLSTSSSSFVSVLNLPLSIITTFLLSYISIL
jgi:hypothetical protein